MADIIPVKDWRVEALEKVNARGSNLGPAVARGESSITRVSTGTLRQLLATSNLATNNSGNLLNNLSASRCVRSLDFQLTDESGRGDLTVEFMARGTYVYHEVQLDVYVDFATAGSQGQYFNLYIRDQGYDYERIA